MDPFGFVSRFVFIEQDKTKLLKELKKMKDDKSVKQSKQSKIDIITTETSNLDDQVELENLLAKYYIHMTWNGSKELAVLVFRERKELGDLRSLGCLRAISSSSDDRAVLKRHLVGLRTHPFLQTSYIENVGY
ncbi:hypothetical protein RhiirC2_787916 [Rhizophagus irregularis]|uniref:Uncharacterized protein n=1 Tax=Rhizophagus irregularis TaxID=588596 RepID=A0A2N1MR93_9GLOM|nr:hypothetical protein RhiirC2_787916 [Rhizophagus irregularis]